MNNNLRQTIGNHDMKIGRITSKKANIFFNFNPCELADIIEENKSCTVRHIALVEQDGNIDVYGIYVEHSLTHDNLVDWFNKAFERYESQNSLG